jgi:MFS family permease
LQVQPVNASRVADRWGRARLLPIGLALGTLAAVLLILGFPWILALVVALLSLRYSSNLSTIIQYLYARSQIRWNMLCHI